MQSPPRISFFTSAQVGQLIALTIAAITATLLLPKPSLSSSILTIWGQKKTLSGFLAHLFYLFGGYCQIIMSLLEKEFISQLGIVKFNKEGERKEGREEGHGSKENNKIVNKIITTSIFRSFSLILSSTKTVDKMVSNMPP
mmetsp:Transcript_37326/g.58794  ORF Transcript_37326/g.58794 Transcript_37326/m.58794 type:complete len:141 (-) Transcript_37326:994-1416(-)